MPNAPLKPCTHPGCGALTSGSRCDQHRVQVRRAADEHRQSASQRGYGSRWQKARAGWLRSHPLCGDRIAGRSEEHSLCVIGGLATPATDVDHVVPIDGPHDALFWQPTNWQSLCHGCHSVKTATENGGFGNRAAPGRAGL